MKFVITTQGLHFVVAQAEVSAERSGGQACLRDGESKLNIFIAASGFSCSYFHDMLCLWVHVQFLFLPWAFGTSFGFAKVLKPHPPTSFYLR